MSVDANSSTGSSSNLNGILEPGESVQVSPTWSNDLTTAQSVNGELGALTGPFGPMYTVLDGVADYGLVGAGSDAVDCRTATGNCYLLQVSGTRPFVHWDTALVKNLASGIPAIGKTWTIHVGASFADVPVSSIYYPYAETLLHNGITAGCGGSMYCLESPISRAQMAVFLLKAKHGSQYSPTSFCQGLFLDVPCDNQFVSWVEEADREKITAGCGVGYYCPSNPVTRAQMAVFLLKTSKGSEYVPPACSGTVFLDVACSGGIFDPWIEDLAAREITGGCGGGYFCPATPNTRGQMAAFLTKAIGLNLYGP